MKSRLSTFGIFLLFLMTFHFSLPFARGEDVPPLMNYSGTLTSPEGIPVADGDYDVEFNIYDAQTGGNVLWTEMWNETTTKILVSQGNFNVMLGAHNPILPSVFADHPDTYLGIKVGSDSEMLPRQRIASVAYAFTAKNGIPKGGIIMWSGAVDQIPEGWALCDGSDGTPDLRDRFVVGAAGGYAVAATGGEASHVLTIDEMPSHNHSVTDPGHRHAYKHGSSTTSSGYAADTNNGNPTQYTENATTGISVNNMGGGAAHNNLPPYYALAFIIKL